jgi:hypothetical protein
MKFFAIRILAASFLTISALTACVQMPTERQGAVDMRPRIMFDVSDSAAATQARVVIDGLDAGPLSAFSNGTGSLRLLSGNHVVQVIYGARAVLEQRIYLADGAQRQLQVNFNDKP